MKTVIRLILVFFPCFLFSQEKELDKTSNNLTVDGNVEFLNKKLIDAESNYRQAISKDSSNIIASYNMANSFYKSGFDDEALNQYKESIQISKNKSQLHKAFHNLGDVYMKKEDYQNAVDAFKNALLNNPSDDETRYNYALAKELLKNQKKNKNEKDKKNDQENDNDDQKNDNKDQKNDNENKKGDEKKDKKQDENDNKEKKKNQPKPNQISPEQLKNLLKAMDNEEKKVQEKVNKNKVKASPKKNKKDW
tara:strand:- start:144 stop:893 length:750 start_codon:yes stop_codon:yes gene_type:complete